MWLKVRAMDGSNKTVNIHDLSRTATVEELRIRLVSEFNAEPSSQRLYYRGKELVDKTKLYEYNVGLNDIIQIIIKNKVDDDKPSKESDEGGNSNRESPRPQEQEPDSSLEECTKSEFYKVGELIDAWDSTQGGWFEAEIVKITQAPDLADGEFSGTGSESEDSDKPSQEGSTENDVQESVNHTVKDSFIYHVKFEDYDDETAPLHLKDIRLRAQKIIPFEDVKAGDFVMVNYNCEEPNLRGFWHDCLVSSKRNTRTIKELIGTVYVGSSRTPLENCSIKFINEIYAIEKHRTLVEKENSKEEQTRPVKRQTKPECDFCLDNPNKKCKHCACIKCGGKNDPGKQIMCDECNAAYHLWCLNPPLEALPEEDEWFCPECKNDDTEVVRAGEKLKESKKRAKMPSAKSECNRDWGKGMACVGRTKTCTIVPTNHFGPIPNVEVGMLWKYRVQVSEAGVHRPPVGGIHGKESDGAYSIVLSGGYEDDHDEGNEFLYTGSGGRDLSGNRRTAEQSCDQTLTRMNKALALNCAAPINAKTGAIAKNWKDGKPVRVVRNCKGSKHSSYSPEEGNRYDGIYKVVKYWPEKGKSGFLVWRYLLRRDDPTPAPWTKEGKKIIKENGFEMQYPEGYLESLKDKKEDSESENEVKKGKGKRSSKGTDNQPSPKKKKISFEIPSDIKTLIKRDIKNQKLWNECIEAAREGKQALLRKTEEVFQCICCQDLASQPVTTACGHNLCKACLLRAFKAEVYSCPMCRFELGKNYEYEVNKMLFDALLKLFPGYEKGR